MFVAFVEHVQVPGLKQRIDNELDEPDLALWNVGDVFCAVHEL